MAGEYDFQWIYGVLYGSIQLLPEVSPENFIFSEALGRILFSPENLKFSQALWRKSFSLKASRENHILLKL
jgi:hypothetical protein